MKEVVCECPKCGLKSSNPNYHIFVDWYCMDCKERFSVYITMKDFDIEQYFIIVNLNNKQAAQRNKVSK